MLRLDALTTASVNSRAYLFSTVGSTADGYFSPTLASISDKLRVPYDVAGVTFLAFGNGAPDVFSSIAAYSSGVNAAGINELLGGAMFVSTVVVGCVALASDVRVQRWSFSRDAGALVVVLLLLVAIGSSRRPGAASAFLLPMLYAVYVASVVLPPCLSRLHAARYAVQDDSVGGDSGLAPPPRGAAMVLSAFWHALSPKGSTEKQHAYTFLTRKDAEADKDRGNDEKKPIKLSSPRKAAAPRFFSKLYEDHFESGLYTESLSSPLIADDDREEEAESAMDEMASPQWLGFTTGGGMFAAAYWRHLRWRWGLKRRIKSVWSSDTSVVMKLLSVPQAVLVVVRDVSVPLLDSDEWRRSLASLSPVTVPLLVLLVTGHVKDRIHVGFLSRDVPIWELVVVGGLLVGIVVSFTTHRSHAPTSFLYSAFFLLLAFVSCVCWIYAVANELVALLVAAGIISHAGNSLLSLTVLAWGNSVGDLITDVSVARAGFAQMAIAGCFGGLVFNILLGLGIPMVATFLSGHVLEIGLDTHARISLAFLLVSLAATIAVFRYHAFHCPPWYGKLLIGYYAVYSVVNLVVAFRDGGADPAA